MKGLSVEISEKLRLYAELLGSANARARLTGPSDPVVLLEEHIEDALRGLPFLPQDGDGKRFIDVGTGGGLPGLVWGVCRPDLAGTLLDSIGRKSALTSEIASRLGCRNIEVICARSEDFARAHRELFHIATARAVAHACVLAEYLAPLVRVGGKIIAFKGKNVRDELGIPMSKWRVLGLAAPSLHPYSAAGKDRCIVIWEKITRTPARFPRRPGMADKKPWVALPSAPG